MGIGDRLRELREQKHLNQEAFGALGGVSIKTQNRYEMGGRKPTFDYLEALAAAGVDVVYLLTGETDPRKLPPREQEMLRLWRGLSAEHQDDAFRLMEAWRGRDIKAGKSKTIRRQAREDEDKIPGEDPVGNDEFGIPAIPEEIMEKIRGDQEDGSQGESQSKRRKTKRAGTSKKRHPNEDGDRR